MAIRSAQAKPARALSHHNSGQMSALLNPTHGMRDEMRRAGLAPKNHQSANIRRIRELEATNREKRSVAEGKSADVWSPETKNQKYAHVTSTVARELAHKPSPRARPATAPAPTSGPRTPSGFTVGRVRDPVRARVRLRGAAAAWRGAAHAACTRAHTGPRPPATPHSRLSTLAGRAEADLPEHADGGGRDPEDAQAGGAAPLGRTGDAARA